MTLARGAAGGLRRLTRTSLLREFSVFRPSLRPFPVARTIPVAEGAGYIGYVLRPGSQLEISNAGCMNGELHRPFGTRPLMEAQQAARA